MAECKHTRKFCASLDAQGALTHVNHSNKYTGKGFPDRTVICPWGLIILLECKDEHTKMRPEQREWLTWLEEKQAPAFICRFREEPPPWFRLETLSCVLHEWAPWSQFFQMYERYCT